MGYSGALIAHQEADRLCTVTKAGSWNDHQVAKRGVGHQTQVQNAIQWPHIQKCHKGGCFTKPWGHQTLSVQVGKVRCRETRALDHVFNRYPHSYPAGRALCCARGSLGGGKEAGPVQPLPCLGTSMRGSAGKDCDSVKAACSFPQGHHSAKFWACLCQTLPRARHP